VVVAVVVVTVKMRTVNFVEKEFLRTVFVVNIETVIVVKNGSVIVGVNVGIVVVV
jgi:hypothetical protein